MRGVFDNILVFLKKRTIYYHVIHLVLSLLVSILEETISRLPGALFAGDRTVSLISHVDESVRFPFAIILVLWVSALSSSFIDNIPFTQACTASALLIGPHGTSSVAWLKYYILRDAVARLWHETYDSSTYRYLNRYLNSVNI